MFYLQRHGSPDQEGPYSYEYLLRMAKGGELTADDLLFPADGGEPFRAGENLEFGDLPPGAPKEPMAEPAMPSVMADGGAPPVLGPQKTSQGTVAVIAVVVAISLCCIPGFLLFQGGGQGAGGGLVGGGVPGVQSMDAISALNRVTEATIQYCNDHDGFFPSGMDSDKWKEQIRPYLEPGTRFDAGPGLPIEANPNLSVIRQGSVIDPRQTLMFFIRKPVFGNQSAVSNVSGRTGYVDSEGLEKSIRGNIYNVPFRNR